MKSAGILGLPFDHNSSYLRGSAKAPQKIREAFRCDSSNMWTENGLDLGAKGLIVDHGDVSTFEEIRPRISEILTPEQPLILLGGDHAVTFPVLQGFKKHFHAFSVLHIDAHPDLYHDFEGNPHSHASPFARVLENNLIERLVQIGIRTLNAHQRQQAARFGVEMIEMKDFRDDMQFEFTSPLYISIDLDGFDPAYAPGVSHHEPGGLSTRQVLRVLQTVKAQIIGADIVEMNPDRDPIGITAMLCGKLMKELAGRMIVG